MEFIIHVYSRFIIKDHENASYHVRLFDRDLLSDDFIAEEKLKADGNVYFQVNQNSYRDGDSITEQKPDFYMVVLKNGVEIFRTPTAQDIVLDKETTFDSNNGLRLDLGTFLVG